jgi:hypothetical protein
MRCGLTGHLSYAVPYGGRLGELLPLSLTVSVQPLELAGCFLHAGDTVEQSLAVGVQSN